MKNPRIFHGINGNVEDISPDSFRFHGPMKALFYKLLKLINPPPEDWLKDIDGNIAILRDIYLEYLQHEKQEWRRDVMTRVIPFSLCLTNYDENYEEVMQWFIFRITEEYRKGHFVFEQENRDPRFWYQDGKGRIGLTKENRIIYQKVRNGKKEE